MSRDKKRKNNGKDTPHEHTPAYLTPAPPAPVFGFYDASAHVPSVYASALHDRNASVVSLRLVRATPNFGPLLYEYKASGSSKREKGDVHDEMTGELIALARALEDLSRQLLSDAGKRVKASAAAGQKQRERIEEKRAKALLPPRHRTLGEWQALQERAAAAQSALTQRERNAKLAENLGFALVETVDSEGYAAPSLALPQGTAYEPRHAAP